MADITRLDNLREELEKTGRHEDAEAISTIIREYHDALVRAVRNLDAQQERSQP